MSLLNFTTTDDVRGALGVSDEELEDDVILLQLYEDTLRAELDEISFDLVAEHASLAALAVLNGPQERFMRYARLFATYAVARALTNTLPMFGPKSVEDGKARVERFQDPYRETTKAVAAEYDRWRRLLQEAYLALGLVGKTRVARPYVLGVAPAQNPITNE
jgi:hypothetical protein